MEAPQTKVVLQVKSKSWSCDMSRTRSNQKASKKKKWIVQVNCAQQFRANFSTALTAQGCNYILGTSKTRLSSSSATILLQLLLAHIVILHVQPKPLRWTWNQGHCVITIDWNASAGRVRGSCTALWKAARRRISDVSRLWYVASVVIIVPCHSWSPILVVIAFRNDGEDRWTTHPDVCISIGVDSIYANCWLAEIHLFCFWGIIFFKWLACCSCCCYFISTVLKRKKKQVAVATFLIVGSRIHTRSRCVNIANFRRWYHKLVLCAPVFLIWGSETSMTRYVCHSTVIKLLLESGIICCAFRQFLPKVHFI